MENSLLESGLTDLLNHPVSKVKSVVLVTSALWCNAVCDFLKSEAMRCVSSGFFLLRFRGAHFHSLGPVTGVFLLPKRHKNNQTEDI